LLFSNLKYHEYSEYENGKISNSIYLHESSVDNSEESKFALLQVIKISQSKLSSAL